MVNLHSLRNQILSLARLPFRHARAAYKGAVKGPEGFLSRCCGSRICDRGGVRNVGHDKATIL